MSKEFNNDKPSTTLKNANDFKDAIQEFIEETINKNKNKQQQIGIMVGVGFLGFVAMILGLFIVVIPITYASGMIIYKEKDFKFWQPMVGGSRFIALNAISWILYALAIIAQIAAIILHHDAIISFISFATGLLSFAMMGAALTTFKGPNDEKKEKEELDIDDLSVLDEKYNNETFADDFMVQYMLDEQGESTTSILFYVFIGLQSVTVVASFWLMFLSEVRDTYYIVKILSTGLGLSMIAVSCALTHALGGKWKHINTNYMAFQPLKGGSTYIQLQFVGWLSFTICQLLGIFSIIGNFQLLIGSSRFIPIPLSSLSALLGLLSQGVIAISIFFFVDDKDDGSGKVNNIDNIKASELTGPPPNAAMDLLVKSEFAGLNLLLGPKDVMNKTREPKIETPDDHLEADKKWEELTKDCQTTNDQYLVIGVGFVGRRLVKRLLDRGETKIRLFDISPRNPFEGDDRIEYVRGDVTKQDQITEACKDVDTIYCTFAIIRFMDRLDFQASLSYRINVYGTECVINACKEQNVKRMVVTSSSHATTDDHSLPRLNRDESAPYVIRETSHNHYGWTKAIADQLALKANGIETNDGTKLLVTIIRPCSGVFGADDLLSFQKAMDMGIMPSIGSHSVMDWIYVENVVLGHLLAEQKLQEEDENVCGEAFNVSNNEACSGMDFWYSVIKIIKKMPRDVVKSRLDYIFIPISILWVIAYIVEWINIIFKGKVYLGRDLSQLTPPMLQTAVMHYSYNSDKAKKYLGYEPAFSVDHAIQRSLVEYWETNYPDTDKKND